ncbi:hypothetical protein ABKN59_008099 [Abortiporus biennis]
MECAKCHGVISETAFCTPCGHLFCEGCEANSREESESAIDYPCPQCGESVATITLDPRTVNKKYHPFIQSPVRKISIPSNGHTVKDLERRLQEAEANAAQLFLERSAALQEVDNLTALIDTERNMRGDLENRLGETTRKLSSTTVDFRNCLNSFNDMKETLVQEQVAHERTRLDLEQLQRRIPPRQSIPGSINGVRQWIGSVFSDENGQRTSIVQIQAEKAGLEELLEAERRAWARQKEEYDTEKRMLEMAIEKLAEDLETEQEQHRKMQSVRHINSPRATQAYIQRSGGNTDVWRELAEKRTAPSYTTPLRPTTSREDWDPNLSGSTLCDSTSPSRLKSKLPAPNFSPHPTDDSEEEEEEEAPSAHLLLSRDDDKPRKPVATAVATLSMQGLSILYARVAGHI